MSSLAVVTDSTPGLPADVVERHGITVVPLHLVADGDEFAEGIDLSTEQVPDVLRAAKKVGTSRPSPAAFLDAYERAAAGGATGVLSVHLSGELSGTVESALLAASRASVPVSVVDSRTVGMGTGFAILSAIEAGESGADLEGCAQVASERAGAATVLFYVESLEYLRRGGRIGNAAALLGTALAIKPLLGVRDGVIEPVARVRTASRALSEMADRAVAAVEAGASGDGGAGVDVAVHQLDAALRADQLVETLRPRCPQASIGLFELGPVLGAHVGPGTLAVVVSPRS